MVKRKQIGLILVIGLLLANLTGWCEAVCWSSCTFASHQEIGLSVLPSGGEHHCMQPSEKWQNAVHCDCSWSAIPGIQTTNRVTESGGPQVLSADLPLEFVTRFVRSASTADTVYDHDTPLFLWNLSFLC